MQWIPWNWVGRASEWQRWGKENQNPRESDLSWQEIPHASPAPNFSCLLPEVSPYCSLDRGRHWRTKTSGMWLRLCKHRGGASPTIQPVGTVHSAPANQEHLCVPKHCQVLEHWVLAGAPQPSQDVWWFLSAQLRYCLWSSYLKIKAKLAWF